MVYKHRHETKHMHRILRWFADLVVLGLNGAAVALFFFIDTHGGVTYHSTPPGSFDITYIACLCMNV